MKNATTSATAWNTKPLFAVFIFLFLLAGRASAQTFDSLAAEESIRLQLERYPASTLQDIYKSFFQDAFGPGHLIDNPIQARLYIEEESLKSHESLCELYEKAGVGDNYYRVSLSLVASGAVKSEQLSDALCRSAAMTQSPSAAEWQSTWQKIERITAKYKHLLQGYEQDLHTIDQAINSGNFMMRHSAAYNRNYHPHYRIIHRTIFETEILPLLPKPASEQQ